MTIVVLNGELKGKVLNVLEKTRYGVVVENPTTHQPQLIGVDDFTEVRFVNYDIKIFNLTTLRKKGFYFTDGVLTIDEDPRVSLMGKMLNYIDATIGIVAETDKEIIFDAYGKTFFIPKTMKGKLYKIVK